MTKTKTKTQARYYIYSYPDTLEPSNRREVSFQEGRKTHHHYKELFVKEHKGRLQVYMRKPFWNQFAWSDWVNPELEEKLRKDLGL